VAYKVDHPFLCSGLENNRKWDQLWGGQNMGGSWAGEVEEGCKEKRNDETEVRKFHRRMKS
jgi:hypothetical protein